MAKKEDHVAGLRARVNVIAEIITFILIGMFLSGSSYPKDMLAPHPLYFTKDGRPSKIKAIVDGNKYVIDWDGLKLSIKPDGSENHKERIKKYFNRKRNISIADLIVKVEGKTIKMPIESLGDLIKKLVREKREEETKKEQEKLKNEFRKKVYIGLIVLAAVLAIFLTIYSRIGTVW